MMLVLSEGRWTGCEPAKLYLTPIGGDFPLLETEEKT